MKRTILLASLAVSCFFLSACEANKAPGSEEEKKEEKPLETIELYITSCESSDSDLCSKDSCQGSDCGIEDYYFTKKGNVIQRNSCLHEESALWIIGKYRISDSGIVCQMEKVYIVPLKYKEDMSPAEVDYNKGEYTPLGNQEPYLLAKSSCAGIRYTKQYNEMQRKTLSTEQTTIYGRVYYENKEWEKRMLEEMRKVNAFVEL